MGRLAPDHKTIADYRRVNASAIRKTCAQFVELCRRLGVVNGGCVAIDGSKFKAVNNQDRNFTPRKIARIDRQEARETRVDTFTGIAKLLASACEVLQRGDHATISAV